MKLRAHISLRKEHTRQSVFRSYAGLTSCFFYRPHGLLFDCGDGTASLLESNVASVENIFISHCHQDHIGGIRNLIMGREKVNKWETPKFTIWTPNVKAIRDEIGTYMRPWVIIREIKAGAEIEIEKNVFVRAFKSTHTNNSLVYGLFRRSKKLNEAGHVLVNQKRYHELTDEHHYIVNRPVFGYFLDTKEWNPAWYDIFKGSEFLIHDCTFLNEADRNDEREHMCFAENIKVVKTFNDPEMLHIFAHVSQRYDVRRDVPTHNFSNVFVCDYAKTFSIEKTV